MFNYKKIDYKSPKEMKINITNSNKFIIRKKNNKLLNVLLIILSIFILTSIYTFIVFQPAIKNSQEGVAKGKELYQFLKNKDIDGSKLKIQEIQQNIKNILSSLRKAPYFKFIPIINGYYNDAIYGLLAADSLTQASIIGIDTIAPYSDLIGLKGNSSFVSSSADDRIKTAVETLDKIIPSIDILSEKIILAEKELSKIDPNRYPEKIGKTFVRERLINLLNLFSESKTIFSDAKPILKQLPDILGNKSTKKYLMLFQNDAELRATGGFITAYAVFKVEKGKIQVERADDIYKLDASKKKSYPAPREILAYHKDVTKLELRDSNLSPDYKVSMQKFEEMLKESIPDFPKIDGIIALDTQVLVEAIKILGEFNIYGKKFNADNDPRCDCPRVIYELEDYSTKPVAYIREDRKDIIAVLLYQIMQRALGVSPSKYWGNLIQMFFEEARAKHILFYFSQSDIQSGFEAINFAGRINNFDSDYLHINDVNFAGAKSNLFVTQSITNEYDSDSSGNIIHKIKVIYKNPAPPSNCNLEAGQLCLNGILRNWVRIYTPLNSKLITFKGSEKDTKTYNDLEKTVFEGFLTLKPQGTAEIEISYVLPAEIKMDKNFKLFFQKQAGKKGVDFIIMNKNKKVIDEIVDSDKIFSIK